MSVAHEDLVSIIQAKKQSLEKVKKNLQEQLSLAFSQRLQSGSIEKTPVFVAEGQSIISSHIDDKLRQSIGEAISNAVTSEESKVELNLYNVAQDSYKDLAKDKYGLFTATVIEKAMLDGTVKKVVVYSPKEGSEQDIATEFQQYVENFKKDLESRIATEVGIARLIQDGYKREILDKAIPATGFEKEGGYAKGKEETPKDRKLRLINELIEGGLSIPGTFNAQDVTVIGPFVGSYMFGKYRDPEFKNLNHYTAENINNATANCASTLNIIDQKLGSNINPEERNAILKLSLGPIARNLGSGVLKIEGDGFKINNDPILAKEQQALEAAIKSIEHPSIPVITSILQKLQNNKSFAVGERIQDKIKEKLTEVIDKAVRNGYTASEIKDHVVSILSKSVKISPRNLPYSISSKSLDKIVNSINNQFGLPKSVAASSLSIQPTQSSAAPELPPTIAGVAETVTAPLEQRATTKRISASQATAATEALNRDSKEFKDKLEAALQKLLIVARRNQARDTSSVSRNSGEYATPDSTSVPFDPADNDAGRALRKLVLDELKSKMPSKTTTEPAGVVQPKPENRYLRTLQELMGKLLPFRSANRKERTTDSDSTNPLTSSKSKSKKDRVPKPHQNSHC